MGIRKSVGKHKKSKKRMAAVGRAEVRRRAALDAGKRRPRGTR